MKKFLCTAAALLLGLSMSLAASAKDYGSVTVLGDSIATGYGLAGYNAGDNYSPAGSFGSLISKDCTGYTNLAKDGATSADLLARLDSDDAITAVSKADSVIISIGGNDFLQPMLSAVMGAVTDNPELLAAIMGGSITEELIQQVMGSLVSAAQSVDVSKSGENLTGIIGKIRKANPDCNIYILTVYDPFENVAGMEAIDLAAKERLPQLNAEIASAAKNGGAEVIDVYNKFTGHAMEYTNIGIMDIHPNAAGHEVIYSLLSNAVKEVSGSVSDPDNTAKDPIPDNGSDNPGTGAVAFVGAGALAAAVLVVSRRKK